MLLGILIRPLPLNWDTDDRRVNDQAASPFLYPYALGSIVPAVAIIRLSFMSPINLSYGMKDLNNKNPGRTKLSRHNTIERTFLEGRDQWIEEPVVSQWSVKDPDIATVLDELNQLHEQWRVSRPGPFCPFSDPLWLQTCEALRDAELPWPNNNLHLPDDIDPSWPFQAKKFEREAVVAKGARVGDDNPSGYIWNWSEGNLYATRALQQEMRHQKPTKRPLLVANRMDPEIIEAAAQVFGMEIYSVGDDWDGAAEELKGATGGERPIIFAATWANDRGQSDDFRAIERLSKILPLVLHVDAPQNFDFVTSLSQPFRRQLGIPRLVLRSPCLGKPQPTDKEMTIRAATIVAAGMNCTFPPSGGLETTESRESCSSKG